MITVDTREKKPLSTHWDCELYTVGTLKTGDYTNGTIIIERKTISDLCNTLGKGKRKFYKELERGFDYLIVEGKHSDIATHLKRVKSRMTPQYIEHCLKEVHEDYGVQVLHYLFYLITKFVSISNYKNICFVCSIYTFS